VLGEGRDSPNSPADEEHQLLLPMALAGGGEFVTMPVTQHFDSHVGIIEKFLGSRVVMEAKSDLVHVRIR
jgi:RNA 3'-terminal phosphate cyclase